MINLFSIVGFTVLISGFAASFFEKNFCAGAAILLLAAGIICCAAIKGAKPVKVCLFAAAAGFALVFANLSGSYYPAKALSGFSAEIEGTVTEVSAESGKAVYTVETSYVSLEGAPQKLKAKLSGFGEYDLALYDKIRAEVTFFTSSGKFSEVLSERSGGVSVYAFLDSQPEILGSEKGSFKYIIPSLREKISGVIDSLYSGVSAELMKQVLIGKYGERDSLVYDAFRRAGMGHILVVSGAHLVIVVGTMDKLIKSRRKNKEKSRGKLFAMTLATVLYMLISGCGLSIMRAGFTAIIYYFAKFLWTRIERIDCLGFAITAIMIINPLACCDVGFLLSVAASLGIILATKPIEHKADALLKNVYWNLKYAIMVSFSVSAAAWIFTLPISMLVFDGVSVLAPFSNIFACFFAKYMLLLGFLSVALGFVPFLGIFASFAAFLAEIFEYMLYGTARIFAAIPFSYLDTDYSWAAIWIVGTLLLFVVPAAVKKSGKYIKYSAVLSASALVFGILCQTALFSGTVSTEVVSLYGGAAVRCSNSGSTVLITKGLSEKDYYKLGLSSGKADVLICLDSKNAPAELSAAKKLSPKTAVFTFEDSAKRYEGGISAERGSVTFWNGAEVHIFGSDAFAVDTGGISILYISEKCDIMNIEPRFRKSEIVILDGVSPSEYPQLKPEYALLRNTGAAFGETENTEILGSGKISFRSRGENVRKGESLV